MMKWRAPAKINLSLRVLGRRDDGFHAIETLMVPVDLADEITVEASGESPPNAGSPFEFLCSDPALPAGPGNLALRAAESFRAEVPVRIPPTRITLTKHIPHGAGLGGGSSDAATVLLALNHIHHAGLDMSALAALAAQLGSDVPFFLYRSAAFCTGRGEMVKPVSFPERLPLLLLKPPFPVPTPWAYQHWTTSHELPEANYDAQPFEWGALENSLERPVFEKYQFLAGLKSWLLNRAEVTGALMSGSGSTMLAILRNEHDADAVASDARLEFGDLWSCPCATIPNG